MEAPPFHSLAFLSVSPLYLSRQGEIDFLITDDKLV